MFEGKASTEDGVDVLMIEDIPHKEVMGGLMANAPSVITSKLRVELLISKKEDDVAVSGVIYRHKEHMFVREGTIEGDLWDFVGRSATKCARIRAFLLLGEENCRSNSCRINTHKEYLWFIIR